MKSISIILIIFIYFVFNSFGQDAASFFPKQAGVTWNFKIIPLDSSNNEINNLSYFKSDSFAAVQNYKGKLANIIVSRIADSSGVPLVPYSDSTFISLDGNEAYSYFKPLNLDSILNNLINPAGVPTNIPKPMNTASAEGWHSYYKFNQAPYLSYQVLTMDTTIDFDSASVTIRYEVKATRLPDEKIQLPSGQVTCKKFNFENIFSYLLTPTFAVPLFSVNDTTWIASDNWVIKEIIPSTKLDLSILNLGIHYLPGTKQVLVSPITLGIQENQVIISDFKLYQNYPNPFNPATKIDYSLPFSSDVKLTIYDILGNEIITLVNSFQNAGSYEIEFNPSTLQKRISSGIYFYRLKSGNSIQTKKLIYMK